ncbi:uncharacterized protein [Littorina saxatilis]|uniref:uncharacterized protein isoform X3 n=1 Tax=Littorina saxatilis TaxID=31220 RepID=UPI0038B4F837
MALAPPERLSDSRPRSMSKLAESPAGPAPIISGRMMTPTKPMSAELGMSSSSTSASHPSVRRRPGSRGHKKEAYVHPMVSIALAAALKAELALAEFDAPPEILQELMHVRQSSAKGHVGFSALPEASHHHHPSSLHPSRNHHHHPHHHHHQLRTPDLGNQHGSLPPPPPQLPTPLTPEDFRARAEKAAEFEVEHNWLLKEEAEMKVKKFDQTKRKLIIPLPDDDPLEGISNRLEEIQSMVKPKAEFSTFLDDLSGEQRDRILKITATDTDELIRDRRHNWKAADFIRNTFRLVYIMVCQCHPGRRYFNSDDPEAGPAVMRRQRKIYGHGKAPIKSSLSEDMQLSLTTQPDFRTNYDLKKVLWVLRATKAFKHLFPTEMEKEVAKVVGYERYDDNRHMGYQGRSAERFYYVLSGRIQLLKEYKLTTGSVNKPMGFMNKGMTSDPEELEQGWLRECHLVSKGPLEVLTLHRDDFIRLQHTVQGTPVDFLWSIDLFKEFPCDQFLHNPDAIEFKYYGQNRIIARDINRTPWLHIVKSGIVKVVRVQYVFDVRNEKKFSSQSTEELGCGRSFSHAEAMLGILAKQRKMKTLTASEFSLPDLFRRQSQVSIEDGKRGRRRKSRFLQEIQQRSQNGSSDVPTITLEETEEHQEFEGQTTPSHSAQKQRSDVVLPPIVKSNHEPSFSASSSATVRGNSNNTTPSSANTESRTTQSNDVSAEQSNVTSTKERNSQDQGAASAGSKRTGSGAMQRMTEAPLLVPHGTFLTREKTQADPHLYQLPPGVILGKKTKKEPLVRRAYLQLDLLKPGDVIGLDDVAQKFRFKRNEVEEGLEKLDPPPVPTHDGPAISLVSDGAEVIKISKRFFLQHAQNNTMLRVETMQRSYLTTDEAKSILYDKETWSQYKNVLMQRLIDSSPR